MHSHLPGDVSQNLVAVLQLDSEHGVGERLDNRPFENDRVFLRFRQKNLSWSNGASAGIRTAFRQLAPGAPIQREEAQGRLSMLATPGQVQ